MTFSSGMTDLGGVSACRLFRLDPESSVFILQSAENGGERLLLGDVRRLGPEALPVLSPEELAALGCEPELSGLPDDVAVLCRVRIPHEKPQDAGFDLGRLVVVNMASGLALETERPGAPLLPLAPQR
ncbi:hypothetical protein [Mailhella sp.]|uniref:hypothetical protein n=1 Tax=Mailhella sp. TaxID=1981029 RepID=UPI004062C7E5